MIGVENESAFRPFVTRWAGLDNIDDSKDPSKTDDESIPDYPIYNYEYRVNASLVETNTENNNTQIRGFKANPHLNMARYYLVGDNSMNLVTFNNTYDIINSEDFNWKYKYIPLWKPTWLLNYVFDLSNSLVTNPAIEITVCGANDMSYS